MEQLQQQRKPSISAQLSAAEARGQAEATGCLQRMVRSTKLLLRQGLPFRGNPEKEGNFQQLLQMQADTDNALKSWLARTTNFTSHQCVEEMQTLFSHAILREIVGEVKAAGAYALVVDGTQDISGKEQESICLRYVDPNLTPVEEFIGLYEQDSTTGEAIARTVKDVLCRLDLPLRLLRAQTYDGAANMSGAFKGCQALISEEQPLALFFHCAAHCTNLVAMSALETEPLVRDAVQCTHELGKLYKRSGKFHHKFSEITRGDSDSPNPATLKPLCPTRWTCRRGALTAVMEQYPAVLQSLEEMGVGTTETASKARALSLSFCRSQTLLGLRIACDVALQLEGLNEVLQARKANVSGMLEAVGMVKSELLRRRSTETFQELFAKVTEKAEELDLSPLVVPRKRKPPARLSGPAEAYQASSPEEHFRHAYFSVLDTAAGELKERFNSEAKSGLASYLSMEQALLKGEVDEAILGAYEELDCQRLTTQLRMLHSEFGKPDSLVSARDMLRSQSPDVRRLFGQVEALVRLMLVCPVSSCEAERSFSALRRVKTWLRSSLGQVRLNGAVVCCVHKVRLDNIDCAAIEAEWIRAKAARVRVFGTRL